MKISEKLRYAGIDVCSELAVIAFASQKPTPMLAEVCRLRIGVMAKKLWPEYDMDVDSDIVLEWSSPFAVSAFPISCSPDNAYLRYRDEIAEDVRGRFGDVCPDMEISLLEGTLYFGQSQEFRLFAQHLKAQVTTKRLITLLSVPPQKQGS